MRRGASSSTRRTAFGVRPARGGSTTTTSGDGSPPSSSGRTALATSPATKVDVLDAVGLRVLDGALARLLDDLDADHLPGAPGQRERDGADAGVEVPHDLLAGQARLLDGELVEALAHRGVGLQERAGRDAQPQPEQLLGEPVAAGDQRRRQPGRDLGQALGLGVQQADALRHGLGQLLDELVAAPQLALRGDQHQQELARALGAAHDEVAQVALVRALVEGREAGRARPTPRPCCGARLTASPDQQADLERQHLVPAAGAVEAERGALGACREGELDLVAVARRSRRRARSGRARSRSGGRCARARRAPASVLCRSCAS